MYHTTVHNHNGGHSHVLQVDEMPSHNHSMIGDSSVGLHFEKDDFVININKGIMINAELTYNQIDCNDMFLNNICDCIVSRFTSHDINLFKAGHSNNLKEMILNFLKKGDRII